jgi:dihydropteroate synthase
MTPSEGAERLRASFEHGPSIMGILNVTPDSFYDGGEDSNVDHALGRASKMMDEGAAIIDIGGESTRPGHRPIGAEQELDRVSPVVQAVANELNIPISIDTTKAAVARAALQDGAHIVNDIWGLQRDSDMAGVIAEFGAGAVLMHNRAEVDPHLEMRGAIRKFLLHSVEIATQAGIRETNLVLDPGVGFGKTRRQNLQVISGLGELKELGFAVLVGVSRKSFIGHTIDSLEVDRLPGTIAANLRAIQRGANIIRVHDVGAHAQALRIWENTETWT